eukprot:863886-Alexandrium_andersonii.AAC.1
MERRLLRDPSIRAESGALRLLPYTGIRLALQGLARPSSQAEALASALRAAGPPGHRREAECCVVVP